MKQQHNVPEIGDRVKIKNYSLPYDNKQGLVTKVDGSYVFVFLDVKDYPEIIESHTVEILNCEMEYV